MSKADLTIRSITARAVDAPISRPVKNAFGVIRSAPLVLIDVATDQGVGAGPLARSGFSRHQDQGRRRRSRQ